MSCALHFLPVFNAPQIEKYFSQDFDSIKEMFIVSAGGIEENLNKISNAFKENNIDEIQKAIHLIRPMFFILGLSTIEQELGQLYNLCTEAQSVDDIEISYTQLWPKLVQAKSFINEQCNLFAMYSNSPT